MEGRLHGESLWVGSTVEGAVLSPGTMKRFSLYVLQKPEGALEKGEEVFTSS